MKRAIKIVGLVLVLVVGGVAVFVATFKPKSRPAVAGVVEATPARVERGRYLVESTLGCLDCHSKRDLSRFGAPAVGPAGAGGDCLGAEFGMPGRVCPPNLTPDAETGLGAWSDGEVARAIREGVDKDGRGLFPFMPFTEYSALSDEDTNAVIAYLRSLPPVKNAVPDTQINFPVSFFVKMAPKPLAGPVAEPPRQDRLAYGRYLARVAGCQSCHTPVDGKHRPLPGLEFAGGREFKGPWGVLRSSNLTPHATGLGDRDEKAFVGMFKAFAVPVADLPAVPLSQATVMPWLSIAKMAEEDLGAIHAFLRTVAPVDRVVEKRPRPEMGGTGTKDGAGGAAAPGVGKP